MSPPADRPKSLARSLGEFFGHIARGVRTDPTRADDDGRTRREVRREVEEVEGDDGVVLRRTTIEEIELPASRTPPADADRSNR